MPGLLVTVRDRMGGIVDARVTATRLDSGDPPRTKSTDRAGQATFKCEAAGEYRIEVAGAVTWPSVRMPAFDAALSAEMFD